MTQLAVYILWQLWAIINVDGPQFWLSNISRANEPTISKVKPALMSWASLKRLELRSVRGASYEAHQHIAPAKLNFIFFLTCWKKIYMRMSARSNSRVRLIAIIHCPRDGFMKRCEVHCAMRILRTRSENFLAPLLIVRDGVCNLCTRAAWIRAQCLNYFLRRRRRAW